MRYVVFLASACVFLAGCSSSSTQASTQAQSTAAGKAQPVATSTSSNPLAKYVELAGFRVNEKGPGKLQVTFGVVNHSDADLGDLTLNVELRATTSKPGDPPLCSFPVKVTGLGPDELKEVSVTVPTKLRAYELPDWQFLKADFQITEPK